MTLAMPGKLKARYYKGVILYVIAMKNKMLCYLWVFIKIFHRQKYAYTESIICNSFQIPFFPED